MYVCTIVADSVNYEAVPFRDMETGEKSGVVKGIVFMTSPENLQPVVFKPIFG